MIMLENTKTPKKAQTSRNNKQILSKYQMMAVHTKTVKSKTLIDKSKVCAIPELKSKDKTKMIQINKVFKYQFNSSKANLTIFISNQHNASKNQLIQPKNQAIKEFGLTVTSTLAKFTTAEEQGQLYRYSKTTNTTTAIIETTCFTAKVFITGTQTNIFQVFSNRVLNQKVPGVVKINILGKSKTTKDMELELTFMPTAVFTKGNGIKEKDMDQLLLSNLQVISLQEVLKMEKNMGLEHI